MTTRSWWDETSTTSWNPWWWGATTESPGWGTLEPLEYRTTQESHDTLWGTDWWKHIFKPKHVDRAIKLFKDLDIE